MAQSMENALRCRTRGTRRSNEGAGSAGSSHRIHGLSSESIASPLSLRPPLGRPGSARLSHVEGQRAVRAVGAVYLSFKPDQADGVRQRILDKYHLELVAAERDRFLTVRVSTPGTDAVEVAAKLQREKSIAVAEPDLVTTKRLRNFTRPDDELFAHEWHLENTGKLGELTDGLTQGADARVIAAWRLIDGLGSDQVAVGVIDDGFDLGHPDLANKAVCPWDFERNSATCNRRRTRRPRLMATGTAPPAPRWRSATPAADTSSARRRNARLMPVRMNESLWPNLVAQWFDHMTDEGAWVVSCSWGAEAAVYPLCDRIAHAIARCAKEGRNGKGCVVLFAAGNSKSDIDDPPRSQNGFATHPDVMAISACSSRDEFSDYSNFGKDVWACAPSSGQGAWDITTADVTGTYIDASGRERSSGYAAGDYNPHFTGTSSACPLAAGVCALVLSANPELTSAEVREIVKSTARKVGPASDYRNGRSVKFGFGCVDAEAAVREALRVAPPVAELAARRARESAPITAARAGARGLGPAAATRARARSAVPNLFDFSHRGGAGGAGRHRGERRSSHRQIDAVSHRGAARHGACAARAAAFRPRRR